MNLGIRLSRALYEEVRKDLARPHMFAAQRVGFLFGRLCNQSSGTPLILFSSYEPVSDDRYINDSNSGARIDSHAIRNAMQQVLNRREGAFHVHMHDWPGKPALSGMDRRELPQLMPSFQAVGQDNAHGLFLLSPDCAAAWVWLPGSDICTESVRISIVGFPCSYWD